MYLRHRFGKWLVVFYARQVYGTGGVDSKLADGNHVLLFDFDGITVRQLETELRYVQDKYQLPTIHVLNTGRPDSWHGYCFYRCAFRKALQILFDCPSIDLNFVRFGIWRDHFTLRVINKNKRGIETHSKLYSTVPETCTVRELDSFSFYQTGSG
jgi:hypothetical protein